MELDFAFHSHCYRHRSGHHVPDPLLCRLLYLYLDHSVHIGPGGVRNLCLDSTRRRISRTDFIDLSKQYWKNHCVHYLLFASCSYSCFLLLFQKQNSFGFKNSINSSSICWKKLLYRLDSTPNVLHHFDFPLSMDLRNTRLLLLRHSFRRKASVPISTLLTFRINLRSWSSAYLLLAVDRLLLDSYK